MPCFVWSELIHELYLLQFEFTNIPKYIVKKEVYGHTHAITKTMVKDGLEMCQTFWVLHLKDLQN